MSPAREWLLELLRDGPQPKREIILQIGGRLPPEKLVRIYDRKKEIERRCRKIRNPKRDPSLSEKVRRGKIHYGGVVIQRAVSSGFLVRENGMLSLGPRAEPYL
jgi:hypothetical protein